MTTALAFSLLAALLQAPAAAPALPAPAPERIIVLNRLETATTGPALEVTSPTVTPGGYLPLAQSGYGRNYSPAVNWTEGPAATKSYVLIVEDPDAGDTRPLLHWLAYDIGRDALTIRDKTKNLAHVAEPVPLEPGAAGRKGARAKEGPSFDQGINDHGGIGWTGPHPPVGDPAHHYHVQVFALDQKTIGPPGATFERVVAAMKGHVIAKGEMVALYQQRPDKVRKPKEGKMAAAPSDPPPETPALPAPDFGKPRP